MGPCRELEKKLADGERHMKDLQAQGGALLKEEVDAEEIAQIVSRWTHIPVAKLLEGETQKLLHMEDRLRERVVGQEDALQAVSNALRRARAGLQDFEPATWIIHFPGPDWRGQDRTGACLGRIHV